MHWQGCRQLRAGYKSCLSESQILSNRTRWETLGHASRDLKIAKCRQPRAEYKSWAHFEELDVTVAESIEIRRKPHPELVALTTSIAGASELPKLAADRLNKVSKLHEATPTRKGLRRTVVQHRDACRKSTQKAVSELDASVTKATEIRRKLYLEFVALTAGPRIHSDTTPPRLAAIKSAWVYQD